LVTELNFCLVPLPFGIETKYFYKEEEGGEVKWYGGRAVGKGIGWPFNSIIYSVSE